jgi:alanine racemase
LGVARVAPVLRDAGCADFFCATLDEALEAKKLLPGARVYCLNGLFPDELQALAAGGVTPVLNDPAQVTLWSEHCADHGRAPAALHIDTGMSRLGLTPDEAAALSRDQAVLEPMGPITLMSHLACAEDPAHSLNIKQLQEFQRWAKRLPVSRLSLANSAGVFLGPEFHADLARTGIALYGGNPTPRKPNPMRQVVRLQGKILQVRSIDAPRTVGYGATHQITRPSRLATVAAGYADGYLRYLSGRATAWVGGTEVHVVGRVSMDLITLDVTDAPESAARPGATIDLIGPDHDVNALAKEAGTIPYEILTSLGARYERRYIEADAPAAAD